MWRSLFSWLGSVLVLLVCFLPIAQAQPDAGAPPQGGGGGEVGVFPWLVAVLFTVLILVVVCMPSRKN